MMLESCRQHFRYNNLVDHDLKEERLEADCIVLDEIV